MRPKTKLIVASAMALSVLWYRQSRDRTASDLRSPVRTDHERQRDSVVVPPAPLHVAPSDTGSIGPDQTATLPDQQSDGPTRPPVDADEERQRLLDDAAEHGVDQTEAIELAETVARVQPLPEAYRAVDRRLATGHTLDEAEEILLGDPNPPTEDD